MLARTLYIIFLTFLSMTIETYVNKLFLSMTTETTPGAKFAVWLQITISTNFLIQKPRSCLLK